MKDLPGVGPHALLLAGALLCCSAWAQAPAAVKLAPVGAGAIWLAPKPSESVRPKPANYRSGEMLKRAVATNTWYSSLMYGQWSDVLHAHPLTFKATPKGMEMGLPQPRTGPVSLLKNWAQGSTGTNAVSYVHGADFTVAASAFEPQDARLHHAGDWNITVEMRRDQAYLRSHILHGSPFAYFEVSSGGITLSLGPQVKAQETAAEPASESLAGKAVHYFKAHGHTYGLYLPSGAKLKISGTNASIEFADSARYFSIGLLPQADAATRQAYAQAAFAFVDNTEVQWDYDEAQSLVRTRYITHTRSMDGVPAQPLIGLYPHHRRALKPEALSTLGQLPSVRGAIAIARAERFDTELRFNGLMPAWPKLQNKDHSAQLSQWLLGDRRRANSMFGKMGNGTYWTGKALGAVAQLMNIAEQEGDEASAAELEKILKQRMESWFSGRGLSYFAHDPGIGSVLGYPEEYFSVSAMNDHHFHYGYWIMAAAQLARRDPQWVSQQRWGGMVSLLVRDIATAQRKRVDFPFLRNFDVYEGHSWARGNSEFFGLGNDQESSSEAIHAWAALALWGDATAQPALKSLGVYLYVTEVSSVLNYWFNAHGDVFHPDYRKPVASMVFGGGYGYSTWWTEEPRQIMGINLLPITPASTYLAQLPTAQVQAFGPQAAQARQTYDQSGQSDGTSKDIWQDIFASMLAIKDPAMALKTWNPNGSVELGDTRSRAFHWMHSLADMGPPDTSVWANVMSHAVFSHPATGKKTYIAYNPGEQDLQVRFSDGTSLTVAPKQVARRTSP
jgi:endoglucanase Acf2